MVNALAAVRAALAAADAAPVAAVTAAPTQRCCAAGGDASTPAPRRDPDGSVAEYRWDWDGDGTVDAVTTAPEATHTFDVGVHRPRLAVVDDDGLASLPVSVEIRVFRSAGGGGERRRARGAAAQPVTFDASAS